MVIDRQQSHGTNVVYVNTVCCSVCKRVNTSVMESLEHGNDAYKTTNGKKMERRDIRHMCYVYTCGMGAHSVSQSM